jgi:hypothetical protein
MGYYWTTKQDLGSQVEINEGGYYESIDRESGQLNMGMNGVNPSSDIPEVCVSGTPQASLFAKIQSARKDGVYHIYETRKDPDLKAPRTSLDFKVLDEYRYNMNKHDSINFDKLTYLNIPYIVVEDIKFAYETAQPNSVNSYMAQDIKSHLNDLINNGSYPQNLKKKEKERRFEELSDAYGEEYAEQVMDYNPD